MATKADYSQQANEICRISYGTSIKGTIVSKSDIRIDGFFKGAIYSTGKVVVGEQAKIVGAVFCQNIDVSGNILGEVCCCDSIILKSTSVISGTVKSKKIGIELDAIFNGTCNIISEQEYEQLYTSSCPKDIGDEELKDELNSKKK